MAERKEITARIMDLLKENPQGLSISGIVQGVRVNRNTAGRYLETLMVAGQVEMRHLGMAKIYRLAQRVPLSAMLSLSTELIMLLDGSLRIIYANGPMLRFLGTTEKNLYGKNIEFTACAMVLEDVFDTLTTHLKEGVAGRECSGELFLKNNETFFSCRIAPAVFEGGQRGVSVLLEDITGRKQAEMALRESEDRYRTLVEISPDAVILHREGKILYLNPAALNLLGATDPNEIVGTNILDYIQPGFRNAVRVNIQKDLGGEITPAMELQMVRRDGTPIIVEGRGVRTFAGGNPAIQVALRDITEYKRAEKELRDSGERYRSLVDNLNVGVFRTTYEDGGQVIEANRCAAIMLGYDSPDDLKRVRIRDMYVDTLAREEMFSEVRKKRTVKDWIVQLRRRDGSIIWASLTANAHFDENGNVLWLDGIVEDITRRKGAEEALRESEATARALLNAPTDSVMLLDSQGVILALNDTAALRFKKRKDELIGVRADDVLPEKVAQARRLLIARVLERGESIRFEDERDGIWYDTVAYPVISETGEIHKIAIIARDITGRRQIEESLRESEENYRNLIERANDGICLIQDGVVKFCNRRITEFWGGSVQEILGRNFADFVHPDALPEITGHYKRRMAGETVNTIYETRLLRKDGTIFYAEVNAGIVTYGGKPGDLIIIRDIHDRKKAEEELRRGP